MGDGRRAAMNDATGKVLSVLLLPCSLIPASAQ
jgi:hypothetical protein